MLEETRFKAKLGERLKDIRTKDLQISQEQLGQQVGVSGATISKWELGLGLPNAMQVKALAQALRCTADELLGLKPETRTFKAGGLQWRVVPPPSTEDIDFKHEVENGVELFTRIVERKQSSVEIQHDPHFSTFSKPALRRLLTVALFSGAIQIVNVDTNPDMEAHLRTSLKLRHCSIADLDFPSDAVIDTTIRREAIAFLAAKNTLDLMRNARSVGLVGGTTISRFVDLVPPASPELAGISWCSLLGAKASMTPIGASANDVVAKMVYKQPGSHGYQMPFINAMRRREGYFKETDGDERDELRHAQHVQGLASSVEIAFLSVGTPEINFHNVDSHLNLPDLMLVLDNMPEDDRRRCVGDVLLTLIDEQGQRVGTPSDQADNDAFVYSIGLDNLRRITEHGIVWILAAQASKAPVLRASITAGLANSVIIENTLAQQFL